MTERPDVNIGILIATLALVGVAAYRLRVKRNREMDAHPVLDDDSIRQIEQDGWIEMEERDEPMDLDHIRQEEARFWEESWDEPEEY